MPTKPPVTRLEPATDIEHRAATRIATALQPRSFLAMVKTAILARLYHWVNDAKEEQAWRRAMLDSSLRQEATQLGMLEEMRKERPVSVVQAVNPVNLTDLTKPKKRKSPKKEKVRKYFEAHPERLSEESRNLEDEIGASHVTIWAVQNELRKESKDD